MHTTALAAVACAAALALAACTSGGDSRPDETETTMASITAAFDATRIRETGAQAISLGGTDFTVTSYENEAYSCGRSGSYPFVVVEQSGRESEELPLWVMLHGGGTGWYDASGNYQGQETYNDAESAMSLLAMAGGYVAMGDTFLGERILAGDRVVLGSLCDHDLMMGLGQPYPDNPKGGTVDGLLANLAMLELVSGQRPTSSTWIAGQSAGSYGAWALAHNLWSRDVEVAGVVMDSGLLGERSFDLFEAGIGAEFYTFDPEAMAAKHGPYFTDRSLYAENAVREGFDVPMFVVDVTGDPGCGGTSPTIPAALDDGAATNCDWLYAPLADAIAAHGDPTRQQVRLYPGSGHVVSATPGPIQADLRAWYAGL
jgi:hypothetical protein